MTADAAYEAGDGSNGGLGAGGGTTANGGTGGGTAAGDGVPADGGAGDGVTGDLRPEDVERLIAQGWDLPDGPGQIAAAEAAVRHADATGDRSLSFAARMLATSAYHRGGEPAKSFVTFSWCLSDYDADPGAHSEADDRLLRWFFKYVVSSLSRFPQIPLERTQAVLDDMHRRYAEGGHSLHAVYSVRWLLAWHVGDEEAADRWYERWCAAPRDENSDCAGCDPTGKVIHLAERGRWAEAVQLAEPVLAGRLTCAEQPQSMLTQLLLPYLHTGRYEQARDAHRRAYRAQRGNVANMVDIAAHLEFCALTGNEVRGLEILQRHVDWLERVPSPYGAMEFAGAAALVLRRLSAAGHGDLTVHRRSGGAVPVARLATDLAAIASDLAGQFDARNGGTHQRDRLDRRLSAEPLVEHLPLSASSPRRTPGAGRRSGPGTDPRSRDRSVEPVIPPDASAEDLLDLAERYGRTDHVDAARAVLRVFDERFDPGELSQLLAARRADGRGNDLAEGRDLAGAERAWRDAVDGYRSAGDELRANVALGRLGVLLCLTGRGEEGLPLVAASRDYVLEHGSPPRRAGALSRSGIALVAVGRPNEALAEFDRAAVEAEAAGDPHLSADIALRRAHCLAGLNRPEEFRDAAERARLLHRPLGGDGLAVACLLYGTSFDPRRPDEGERALAAFDEAVDAAPTGRSSIEPRLARARALCALDRPAEAIDDFVEVVALCTQLEVTDGSAFGRLELAEAYRLAGRALEAAEVGEEALTGLTSLEAVQAADRCRYLLASAYRDLGEDDAALAMLDTLAANLDGYDNLPARGQMHEEAAELLYKVDRDAQAADRFLAAAEAFAAAGLPLDELRARRRYAMALRWAGDIDAAVVALAGADAVAATLPTETATALPAEAVTALPTEAAGTLPAEAAGDTDTLWETAMLGYDAAKILIAAERLEEALARIGEVPRRLRAIDAFGEAFMAELLLGEVLLRMDRPTDAEPVLRRVLGGLPRDAEPLAQAAWLLSQSLSMQGRQDEARALRAEHGIDVVHGPEDETG